MEILRIENLSVSIDGKPILKNINLSLKEGEIHAIFGPNGSGKSTLLFTIMGMPNYRVIKGKIIFKGKNILKHSINERAKMGIFLAFQNPPAIKGVKVKDLFKIIGNEESVNEFLNRDFLNREINVGFSGGERKKLEVAQIFSFKPKLLLLDEIDSGLDIESLEYIGERISNFIEKEKITAIVVTHQGNILKFIKPRIAHVMMNGKIVCSGEPKKILETIKKFGYERCEKCK
ncbi:MAG: ABC transporter ATP-binding protein [Candidatus Aenigmatarchaeota archaeon]|jgi:Fe-S cluster assembly ATP-binding protein